MKTKLFCMLFLCCCIVACEKNEPGSGSGGTTPSSNPKISGTASVLSSSGRTSCDYVQLWGNGPKWATFNVGTTIMDYANLTAGIDSVNGNIAYYNTANVGGLYPWNNPNLNGRKTTWGSSVSTGISDVATSLWGSNWKTPTKEQLDTLCNEDNKYGKTTWTWCDGSTTQYVKGCTLAGYKVLGVGDYAKYSIFLPVAGYFDCSSSTVYASGYYGGCWSSTEDGSYYGVDYLYFYSGSHYNGSNGREYGRAVRAVLAQWSGSVIPTVTTNSPAASVTANSAIVSGSVTSDGGQTITARGICYSKSQNPTISDKVVAASSAGIGTFSCTLVGLASNTTYYARAYATNSQGTSYGATISFTTMSSGSSSTSVSGTASVLSSSGRTSCEWVQLWKNGPKWATFNVGATITDYANLTAGTDATSGNVAYYNTANVGGLYPWNNPNLNGRKTTWNGLASTGISDVATSLWGSNWKTPTQEQLDTLCNEDNKYGKTTWTWCDGSTTQYVKGCTLAGYKITGVGDYAKYSIFLPAAGYFVYSSKVHDSGRESYYWSSMSVVVDSEYGAYSLNFVSDFRSSYEINDRRNGWSVRAVLAK